MVIKVPLDLALSAQTPYDSTPQGAPDPPVFSLPQCAAPSLNSNHTPTMAATV